jgi:DNA-binding protein YbaB
VPSGNIAERIATLSASATGEDGLVTVTVSGPGVVTGLRLDDRVQRLTGEALSAEILETMQRAQSALARRVAAAVDETAGAKEPPAPVMPAAPPFPTFQSTPTLPHQVPGNGFESGRDSRAR